MRDVQIRLAQVTDIEAVEKLTLQTFPSTFGPALGNRPLETQIQVFARLRQARRCPVEGCLVAMHGADLAGILMWKTAEMGEGQLGGQLRALSPLGLLGALRFLLVRTTVYSHYKPASKEAYLSGLAVVPAYRGRGIALALMRQAEEEARQAGKSFTSGFVASNNLASRAMLQKLGYREVHTQRTLLRGWVLGETHSIRVEKTLETQENKL